MFREILSEEKIFVYENGFQDKVVAIEQKIKK